MSLVPYYDHGGVQVYLGDCRTVLPQLDLVADCAVVDPPYGETSLAWDRWPNGWPAVVAEHTRSMWCFGSLRMFLERRDEFAGWKLSQDTIGEHEVDLAIWEKGRGTSFVTDRFVKVHEVAAHWYRGRWEDIYRDTPRESYHGPAKHVPVRTSQGAAHHGARSQTTYVDDGTRLVKSVFRVHRVASVRQGSRGGLHDTEKPLGILDPLISYACPPGGTVLDCFAGSGSTLVAARDSGRRAVGVEISERYCEIIARRLDQGSLFAGVAE